MSQYIAVRKKLAEQRDKPPKGKREVPASVKAKAEELKRRLKEKAE